MSMQCSVLGLTPAQIDALVARPALVTDLVLVAKFDEIIRRQQLETSSATDDRAPTAKERQLRIAEARERIARLGSFEPPLDLEKWWHILHYVLTGEIGPAGGGSDLLLTGQELGEDMGYGPARLHGPAETKDFSRFLERQDLANLQARIDLGETSRLYPGRLYPAMRGPADAEYLDMLRNNVGRHFVRLQDYVRKMADRGNGLLIWVI
jgi:hypothetical protein